MGNVCMQDNSKVVENRANMKLPFSYEIDILGGKLQAIPISKVLDRIGFPLNYKDIARIDENAN